MNMETGKPSKGAPERHFAITVEGLAVTFECRSGHTYTVDFSKRPIPQRPSGWWLKRTLRYWSKENGGVSSYRSDCPKCRKEMK